MYRRRLREMGGWKNFGRSRHVFGGAGPTCWPAGNHPASYIPGLRCSPCVPTTTRASSPIHTEPSSRDQKMAACFRHRELNVPKLVNEG